jgi:N-acetylmuramoyl-L-alanine amidase
MKWKKIFGIFFILVLNTFVFSQQSSQNQECLQKAHQFKDSVFVLLDPGHGGPSNNGRTCTGGDPGAIGHPNGIEYHEACMTTDLALGVRDILWLLT